VLIHFFRSRLQVRSAGKNRFATSFAGEGKTENSETRLLSGTVLRANPPKTRGIRNWVECGEILGLGWEDKSAAPVAEGKLGCFFFFFPALHYSGGAKKSPGKGAAKKDESLLGPSSQLRCPCRIFTNPISGPTPMFEGLERVARAMESKISRAK